jgi:hypothetical protein
MVEIHRQPDDQLWRFLSEEIPDLDHASAAQRDQLLRLARSLVARDMPIPFIFCAVRSTAGVLHDLESTSHIEEAMQREEVRRFIAENGASRGQGRRPEIGRETRLAERERLYRFATAAVRDARSAKARHEIKKTRNVLLKIDQRELRRVLGKEADDLCRQINAILRARAPMF